MAKMVYNEWYGEITVAEQRAIKKFNVSPVDHQMLCDEFGEANHDTITQAIKSRSENGMYRLPLGSSW